MKIDIQTFANRFHLQPIMVANGNEPMLINALSKFAEFDTDNEAMVEDWKLASLAKEANLVMEYGGNNPSKNTKPFAFVNGLAVIPVSGLLINKFNYCLGDITGYNFIRNQMNAALKDDDVKAIVFDCDSCGGEVAGCFELADDIVKARAEKPSIAVVDPCSYSACYAIASSASIVVATRSSGVGSIGVVCMHVDVSGFLSKMGIKVTYIFSGDHKVDGNMFEPLPKAVKESIQSRVDETRSEFVALVATNRGMDTKTVYDTEAATYSAKAALKLGLIDAIAQPQDAVQAFMVEQSRSGNYMETTMSTKEKSGEENTTAPVDANAVKKAERTRMNVIMTHENAKGREALAQHLATNTDMSAEDAIATLAVSEKKVEKAAVTNLLGDAMDKTKQPNVKGEDASADDKEETPKSRAAQIIDLQNRATGSNLKVV